MVPCTTKIEAFYMMGFLVLLLCPLRMKFGITTWVHKTPLRIVLSLALPC